MNSKIEQMNAAEVRHHLTHAGLILLAFELVKRLVVTRIKGFYENTTFGEGLPFKSYEHDVLARHRDVFEASLLYLRDHMQAINADEMQDIQELRRHRNRVAHELSTRVLDGVPPGQDQTIVAKARASLFSLSNYWVYIDVGHDPNFQDLNFETAYDWDLALLDRVIGQLGDDAS